MSTPRGGLDRYRFLFRSTGMFDAPAAGMTTLPTNLSVPTQDGHTATFSYGLSPTQGWVVRAQIDDRVLTRHCSRWSGVEHLYAWFRMAPHTALLRRMS